MNCIKNNSIINKVMFAPRISSYDEDLGVCWIDNICCLFLAYANGKANVLVHDSVLETRPVIIICHGNACDIGNITNFGKKICVECRSHVLLYEYPGYGLSIGTPTENSCVEGIIKVINHLNEKMNIPIQNMIFFGQSIGSGIATAAYKYCKTQFNHSPAALILISPYLSIKALAKDILSSTFVPVMERFDSKENIKCCDTGLLIIHGEHDQIIPVSHGIALNEISTCRIKILDIVLDATHNNIPEIRILSKCNELFKNILNLIDFNVLYHNNNFSFLLQQEKETNLNSHSNCISTVIASSVEATTACSINTSNSLIDNCILF